MKCIYCRHSTSFLALLNLPLTSSLRITHYYTSVFKKERFEAWGDSVDQSHTVGTMKQGLDPAFWTPGVPIYTTIQTVIQCVATKEGHQYSCAMIKIVNPIPGLKSPKIN